VKLPPFRPFGMVNQYYTIPTAVERTERMIGMREMLYKERDDDDAMHED
jgi:hypothetical protein